MESDIKQELRSSIKYIYTVLIEKEGKMTRRIKYRKEFCEKLINHMKKGNSFQTFALEVDVTRDCLYKWVEKYPAFAKAKQKAEASCLKFFEGILAAKVSGQNVPNFDPKKSDTSLLIFALKTRFHEIYGDKKQIEVNHSGNIDSKVEQLDYSKLSDEQLNTLLEITRVAKKES